VIPHNYQQSSYPVSTFVWTIENMDEKAADVALMFTFQNGTGGENDRAGGHHNTRIQAQTDQGEVVGVQLHHNHRHPKPLITGQKLADQDQYQDQLTFGIGALETQGIDVSYLTRFNTDSTGKRVWDDFSKDGRLANGVDERSSTVGGSIGGAVCARVHIPAGESHQVVFALVWDMPIARFPSGTGWYRRYTKFYGRNGDAAPQLLIDALTQFLTGNVRLTIGSSRS
jgi:non-lysosomal glucosylceramidase